MSYVTYFATNDLNDAQSPSDTQSDSDTLFGTHTRGNDRYAQLQFGAVQLAPHVLALTKHTNTNDIAVELFAMLYRVTLAVSLRDDTQHTRNERESVCVCGAMLDCCD